MLRLMSVTLSPSDCLVIGQEDGTISIDSDSDNSSEIPSKYDDILYDTLVSGVIDRYSCHYSSQYLVSVFDISR